MNEQLATILAGFLAPLLVSIFTTPILFSKTYIETFTQPEYSFSKQTAKRFIKNTTILYLPLSLTWTALILALWLAPVTVTNESTQTFAFIFLTTLALYEGLVASYTTPLKNILRLNQSSQFTPHTRAHTIILTTLSVIQLVALLAVFLGLITLF